MISILFTRKRSIYKALGQDCWDETRDARKWPGGNAIIAHPPCRAWGKFQWNSKHTESEKRLAEFAIHKVRMWGGVVEHPRHSSLWKTMQLPEPGRKDKWGGYTICVRQSWFGHKASKETILYIVGINEKELPAIPYSLDSITNKITNMGKPEREHTPEKLAIWLIETGNQIEKNKIRSNENPKHNSESTCIHQKGMQYTTR